MGWKKVKEHYGIKRSKKENGSILDGETFKEYPKIKEG